MGRDQGLASVTEPAASRQPRASWKAVAVPAEHGGWSLALEPALLGLLIAPSAGGWCIALGAFVAFVARTPAKLVAIDRRRGRSLARTRLARRIAAGELAVLALLAAGAFAWSETGFWIPGTAALPLLAVEAWFEVRSRGRQLVPELAGAAGVCSVAAMVLLAGGEPMALAIGAWAVLAARVVSAIPHVRNQIASIHGRSIDRRASLLGDLAAVALVVLAVVLDGQLLIGAVTVATVVGSQRATAGGPAPRAAVLGAIQAAMGVAVVLATAVGVVATA